MILEPPYILPAIPNCIVSLVPSQTELLHYLNLEQEVAGITKFCIHPKEWFRSKTKVGGTKTINISTVKKLQPNLIIANKEENVKEQIDELARYFDVLVTDVNNVDDALQMIITIGQLTGRPNEATTLVQDIKTAFSKIPQHNPFIKTAYLIWNKPYMSVGGDTFINDMLHHAGFQNIFAAEKRYPVISVEQLKNNNCELILLSTEPYPFKQKHIEELQQQLPGIKIMLADGEMFSWYGSSMLLAAEYLQVVRREA